MRTRKTSISQGRTFKPYSSHIKTIVTVGIVFCSLLVLGNLIASNYLSPEKLAQSKLEIMAKDYYENYYYDKFVESIPAGTKISEAMSGFANSGFSEVTLRHLLLFDNKRNDKYSSYFDTESYTCDKTGSTIRIIPVAPYGRTDYSVVYNLACNYR